MGVLRSSTAAFSLVASGTPLASVTATAIWYVPGGSELAGMPVASVRTGRRAPSAACENALRLECTIAPFGRLTASSNTNVPGSVRTRQRRRSEEHTSELQSQSNLVCRLLLEKKK